MDERGYAFTPLVFLLFIPIMLIAVSLSGIVQEANTIASITMGGDVSYSAVTNIVSAMEKGSSDAGRNSAYNASRKVIDSSSVNGTNPFFASGTSKTYIINSILPVLNGHVITTCKQIEYQTGRQIYINNILVDNYTTATFSASDLNITQTEPYGFFVNIKGGIPLKIVQKDQVYEGKLPPISSYVSVEGMEDPYIWVNSRFRQSNIIYKYPYYRDYGNVYFFDDTVDEDNHRLYFLWDCLNGTGNPSNINPRPYYFPNQNGLTFFDRLENRSSSGDPNVKNRMSTFIIEDPLRENHGSEAVSRLDQEYFNNVAGTSIEIGTGHNREPMQDPSGNAIFYLSTFYKNYFGLEDRYN
ncbi:MAG: hypothetical protein ACXVHU_06120 [Methanobacterium sp.]